MLGKLRPGSAVPYFASYRAYDGYSNIIGQSGSEQHAPASHLVGLRDRVVTAVAGLGSEDGVTV